MFKEKKEYPTICRLLPGELQISATCYGPYCWTVQVEAIRPLEQHRTVTCKEEAECLIEHLAQQYDGFQELLDELQSC